MSNTYNRTRYTLAGVGVLLVLLHLLFNITSDEQGERFLVRLWNAIRSVFILTKSSNNVKLLNPILGVVDLEGSQAAVHHPFLQGEYELVMGGLGLVLGEGKLNSNNSLEISPVWQKSDKKLNKKFYIFQRNGGK